MAPAIAGTLVIHALLGLCGARLIARYRPAPDLPQPAPRVTIVDVELPAAPKSVDVTPLPSAQSEPRMQPEKPAPPSSTPPASKRRANRAAMHPRKEPSPASDSASPGAESVPVVSAPEIGLGATGVQNSRGTPSASSSGEVGGTGTGTRKGAVGVGVASIATIKTRAMPRGDFAYSLVKDYPPLAKQRGIEGKIRVKLIVDDHGTVASATLLNRLGYGLDELAARRARQLVFDPARDSDDQPVRSVVIWTFDFTLPK